MIAFLTFYFGIYSLLNLYVLRWLGPAFGWRIAGALSFAVIVLLVGFMPIVSRVCDERDYFLAAQVSGALGYAWLLILMWVFSFGLLAEIWNLMVSTLALKYTSLQSVRITPRFFVGSVAVLSLCLTAWGLIEAQMIKLQTVTIKTSKFPAGTPQLRILHFSDAHFSPLVNWRHYRRMKQIIDDVKPDAVLCSGDLFDSSNERMGDLAVKLEGIKPPLGKFAVLGNHEYYIKLTNSLYLLSISGFKVLRAENMRITHCGADVLLAGVDDEAGRVMNETCMDDESTVLPSAQDRPFTILLKHNPRVAPESKGRFDLQLSGHTHSGQVFPFQFYVRLFYPMFKGLYQLADGSHIYVSPGVGTWGPPLRVLARPTMTLFVIQSETE